MRYLVLKVFLTDLISLLQFFFLEFNSGFMHEPKTSFPSTSLLFRFKFSTDAEMSTSSFLWLTWFTDPLWLLRLCQLRNMPLTHSISNFLETDEQQVQRNFKIVIWIFQLIFIWFRSKKSLNNFLSKVCSKSKNYLLVLFVLSNFRYQHISE